MVLGVPIFKHYRVIQVLPFLNNPKDLDPSYKMGLDFWDCLGTKKNTLITEEICYFASSLLPDNQHVPRIHKELPSRRTKLKQGYTSVSAIL